MRLIPVSEGAGNWNFSHACFSCGTCTLTTNDSWRDGKCREADLRGARWVISEPGHILTLTMHIETHRRTQTHTPTKTQMVFTRPQALPGLLACLPAWFLIMLMAAQPR